MDFAPVAVGYWNCLDEKPKEDLLDAFALTSEVANVGANESVESVADREEEAEDDKVDLNDIFDGLTSQEVGGQSFCEHCRCFESGLVPKPGALPGPKKVV